MNHFVAMHLIIQVFENDDDELFGMAIAWVCHVFVGMYSGKSDNSQHQKWKKNK